MNKHMLAAAVIAMTLTQSPAGAWERKTVGAGIEQFCEGGNPEDWQAQDECIATQWHALKSMLPHFPAELQPSYDQCKAGLRSAYDFGSLLACFNPNAKVYWEALANTKTVAGFEALPVRLRCEAAGVPLLDVRGEGRTIIARFGANTPMPMTGGQGKFEFTDGPYKGLIGIDGGKIVDRREGKEVTYPEPCTLE